MSVLKDFPDSDPFIQSTLSVAFDNNLSELNAAIAENGSVNATSVSFNSQAAARVTATPLPDVSLVANTTIGNAVSGIGQQGAPVSGGGGGGGGGGSCFIGSTLITLVDNGMLHYVPFSLLYENKDKLIGAALRSWNGSGFATGRLADVFQSIHYSAVWVTFENRTGSSVIPEHRFLTPSGEWTCIKELVGKSVIDEHGGELGVKSIEQMSFPRGMAFYNLHESLYQNYCADKRLCHNLKPPPDVPQGFQENVSVVE